MPETKTMWVVTALALALAYGACGDEAPAGGGQDALDDAGVDVGAGDAGAVDALADPGAAQDSGGPADVGPQDAGDTWDGRVWRHRAIGGISMGAMAGTIALRYPELFDTVGALGGYIDLPYLVTTGMRLQLAGFCPLETLEAYPEALDDPSHDPPIFCGPAQPVEELEVAQSFNSMTWDDNGADFNRGFYLRVFQSFVMAFGNFTSEPSDVSPYLPTGLTYDWLQSTGEWARCNTSHVVAAGQVYNLEYNPTAAYDVVTFCDGGKPVTEGLTEADYDPAANHNKPVDIGLAVDINGNGRRDYGEPWVMNPYERFDDYGADGCPSEREDGLGGCLTEDALPATALDPNGDDFHWWERPDGGEGDHVWEEGEPFRDDGLDGVAGTGDTGEGNGVWDTTSALARALDYDATGLMAALPEDALDAMDFYFDAGIRDPLNAAVGTRHVVGQLQKRTGDVTLYSGMAGRASALMPELAQDDVYLEVFGQDFAPDKVGRHVYVEYGDPNATEQEIANGDGKHVGTDTQALNRLLTFIVFAIQRFPGADHTPGLEPVRPLADYHSFYSEGLKARRGYTIALPPGYVQLEGEGTTYPTLYFLHGLGQDAADLAPAALATSYFMEQGDLAKALIVFADGACCQIHTPTGRRECACRARPDAFRACIDPDCTGPEETCEERLIHRDELTDECNGGSLYFDLQTNKWGEPRDDLGYMQSVAELVEDVDAHFRTRSAP